MILLLYGPDDYRRGEKRRAILEEFRKKHSSLGVAAFDFAELDATAALGEFLRSQSIFEAHKLAIVEGGFTAAAKPFKEILLRHKDDPVVTIILSETSKPLKAFGFLLEKPVQSQEFKVLADYEWELFLRKEAKARGVSLGEDAFRFIAGAYQGDSWRAVTEIEKLAAFGRREVGVRDLQTLDIEIKPDYWMLMQGLKGQDLGRRLSAFERLLSENEAPAKIFNILSAMWPEKLPVFAAHDVGIKSGKLDYDEALLDLVL